METVFISKLKPLLDAVANEMAVYVPKKAGEYFTYAKYDPASGPAVEFNAIRPCVPIKEFLQPLRERAATFPETTEQTEIEPFAVFGLKDCDMRSINILDKVFAEEEFMDTSYVSRREKMFIISSDCGTPGESCFCNVLGGDGYSTEGFDLNVSQIKDGFLVEAGSEKGEDFISKNSQLFNKASDSLLSQRDNNRAETTRKLEENNADMEFDASTRDIFDDNYESDVYDVEAEKCIECQACTRVCPTCHCFYLYDTKQKDYFAKMKMWDSCMRMSYAMVAGGANPNKMLGERLRHRLMHKFVYFLDRYGLTMCVGCGRCVDSDAGGIDLREILKNLSKEHKKGAKSKVTK